MNTKSSTTLRFLESHEVFTLDEFLAGVDPTVGQRTRYLNLQNAVKRDQATRLAHGLYASNLGAYRDRVPNPLLVAAKCAPDALPAYHSALEAHGVAHTPSRTVYYTASGRTAGFEVRGYRFRQVAPPRGGRHIPALAEFVSRVRAGDALVTVTDRERALVDCLARPTSRAASRSCCAAPAASPASRWRESPRTPGCWGLLPSPPAPGGS